MASAKFLEEALSTDVDESAVNAIVGSLETQLVTSTPAALNSQGQSVSVQQNHINTSISNGARGSTLKHGVSNNGSDSINTILNSDASKSVTTDHHNAVNSVVASLQAGAHSGAYINQLNSGIGILPSSLTGVNKSSDGVKLVYPSSSQTAASVNNRICYPNQSVTLPNGNIGVSSSLPANSSQTVPQSFSQANSNNVNKVNIPSGMDQNKPTGTALVIKSGSNSSQSSATIPTMTLTGTTNTMPGATSSGVPGVVLSKPAGQGVGTQAMVGNSPQIVPSNSVQIVNVNALRAGTPTQPGAKTITQRVMIPHMIGARPGQPGHITLQTLQGLGPGTQGHLLLKTENGQYQLLRVGPAAGAQGAQGAQMSGNNVNTTFRVQTITGAATPGGVQSQVPSLVTQSSATSSPNSVVTGRGAVDQTKEKCRKFLANLLELSTRESKTVERSVRTLIQELVDTKVEPEQFCDRLERLLNASPQPCLIGFLKKSLPLLRQSMVNNELVIDGIRPPPLSVLQSTPVVTSQVRSQFQMTANPQIKVINQQASRPVQQVQRIITPMRMGTSGQVVTSGLKTGVATIRSPAGSTLRPQIVRTPTIQLRPGQHLSKGPFTPTARPLFTSTASSQFAAPSLLLKSGQQAVQIKEKKTFSSSGYVGDDDINDVAAMGGVNLAEESQRILGSTEFVGTQIRSCKDELFLHTVPLINRIARIAKKHGLDDPNLDVASLISHATQERLKTLVEKLSVIAEHRIDFNKADPKYEVSQDVRTQLKCLEEVDRAERKRHEEQERELLLRAAKSRTKPEDPEQQKLKAKAKEMQRAEMEELRQREANLTALLAIGPRKKAKMEEGASSSSSTLGSGSTNLGVGLRPRTKRVCLRDVLVMLEQEKETSRSNLLYKCYFK